MVFFVDMVLRPLVVAAAVGMTIVSVLRWIEDR